jgi:hypothetical protein
VASKPFIQIVRIPLVSNQPVKSVKLHVCLQFNSGNVTFILQEYDLDNSKGTFPFRCQ